MIKNGYYYPVEFYRELRHYNYETKEVEGRAQIGICFGNRTGGKTVGHGIRAIERYFDTGETCMVLAKTAEQKKAGYLEKWWEGKILCVDDKDGVISKFKRENTIEYTKDVMMVNGCPFCYCEAISMSEKVKDEGSYKRCTTIIKDEAVQFGERTMVINGRPAMRRIFEIWQTVARGWEHALDTTVLVFIANTSERDNWVFRDLGVNSFVRNDTKFTVQKGIVVQIVSNKIVAGAVEKSVMGQIMMNSESGKEYYESAQMNEFQDNTSFISPMGLDFMKIKIQLVSRLGTLGVFETDFGYHIAKIELDDRAKAICNDISVHTEDIKFSPMSNWVMLLDEKYQAGKITFQDLEAKNQFLSYIKYIR